MFAQSAQRVRLRAQASAGGDSAYPGIAPDPNAPNEALGSYYKGAGERAGHEADIYVARIRVG